MAPSRHAPVSASGAHQWLLCPPSIRKSEGIPDAGSEAAMEGTLAHTLAEHHLTKMLDGKKVTTPKAIKDDPLYKPAMEEHVRVYCDAIMETYNGMPNGSLAYLEQELDLSYWIPEGFGTTDCILIGDGTMHVWDFKYGKGVPVVAEENPQLKIYGLGALREFEPLYDINTVVLHIVQPRLDSITEWEVSAEILKKWGEFILKPAAKKAFDGEGDFNPGEDQCRWCRFKPRCRAYTEWVTQAARMRFDDLGNERLPDELSNEEIGELLSMSDEIKRWASGVADWALDQALNHGAQFAGWKLVEGRSVRKIEDEASVIRLLAEAGYKDTVKLKGITDLESIVGKKKFGELVGDYVVKPPGKPVLAPETDKRPVYNAAETVFTDLTEEKEK